MDIRSYRKSIGLSQRDFGALFGVTQGAVSQWERCVTTPSGIQAAAIVAFSKGEITLADIYAKPRGRRPRY